MAQRYTTPNETLRAWLLRTLTAEHLGAVNAITWADLARKARGAGFQVVRDERNLREEVNALQAGDGPGALIVTSRRPPYGVFVAATMAEVEAYLAQIMSQGKTLMEKARRQERAAEAAFRARAVQPRLL